jgi:hypothetical protein
MENISDHNREEAFKPKNVAFTTGARCFAEGLAFAERSSRQSALGENPIGKGFFAESRLSGTRQSLCAK